MRAFPLLACVLVSAGLVSGPADARPRQEERRERQEQRQEPRDERREERQDAQRPDARRDDRGDRSADAARRAQQRNGGGRVLAVDPEDGGYRVKVLKDGEVRTHHVGVDD